MNPARGFRKQAPRIDLRQPAVLINSDGTAENIVILDVSAAGFRVELPGGLHKGEIVTPRAELRDDVPGQICWALGKGRRPISRSGRRAQIVSCPRRSSLALPQVGEEFLQILNLR